MSKVKVTTNPTTGEIITQSASNPEFGYVRVESQTVQFRNGWADVQKRSALIRGKVTALEALNLKENSVMSGKIVIKESLTPSNPENLQQDLKVNPKTSAVLTVDGQPIYRTAFYTEDSSASDVFVKHDVEETTVVSTGMTAEATFGG